MKEHLCRNHPDGKRWVEGPANRCPFHEVVRSARTVRMGRTEKRRADARAGIVGRDSGFGFYE